MVFKKVFGLVGSYSWQSGSVSGTVYHGGDALTQLNADVFKLAAWSNPLHADVFPGACKMEAEVVRMVANLFHGSIKTCGSVNSSVFNNFKRLIIPNSYLGYFGWYRVYRSRRESLSGLRSGRERNSVS